MDSVDRASMGRTGRLDIDTIGTIVAPWFGSRIQNIPSDGDASEALHVSPKHPLSCK